MNYYMENKENTEWTAEKLVAAFTQFHEALLYVEQNHNVWDDTVKECEDAFLDIRHFCELNYPKNRRKRTEVVRDLRDYSQKRRKYKDLLVTFSPLFEEDAKDTKGRAPIDILKKNGLYTILNKIEKENGKVSGARYYRPRVIPELWDGEEEPGE